MLRLAALFGLIGLAVATGVIIYSGYEEILQALSRAGFGILWTSLFHLVPMFFCVIGWQVLMPGKNRPSLLYLMYVLWLRTSVNNLMPVARIGGELISVRVMIKHGIRKTSAIASTVVELTASVIAVFVFDVIGISLFTWYVGDQHLGWQLLMGLLLSAPVIAVMVVIQRAGFFGLLDKVFTVMIRDKWKKFAGDVSHLDRAVHNMYKRRDRVLICGFWQLMAWVSGTGEIWLALYFLGFQVSLLEAFMLEALIQAASSVAFLIPGSLGVQEAAFLLFGRMLGLPSDIAAALAVVRRCRDLLLYVPGLIVWQVQEGKWLLGSRRA